MKIHKCFVVMIQELQELIMKEHDQVLFMCKYDVNAFLAKEARMWSFVVFSVYSIDKRREAREQTCS